MGHNIKFPEHMTRYSYIQLTAHVLWSHSCITMGTFPHHLKKKKKTQKLTLESQRTLTFLFYFPQDAPCQLSCTS